LIDGTLVVAGRLTRGLSNSRLLNLQAFISYRHLLVSDQQELRRTSAISATARKLAVIIWNMITKKLPYKTDTQYEFLNEKRKRKVMEKLIHKFDITPDDLGLQLSINNL
jgi:hypothetical protein